MSYPAGVSKPVNQKICWEEHLRNNLPVSCFEDAGRYFFVEMPNLNQSI